MKNLIMITAMLFITGIAQGQLYGTDDYTTELKPGEDTISGVKYKTDNGTILKYNAHEFFQEEIVLVYNECKRILKIHNQDIQNPKAEEFSFIPESIGIGSEYTEMKIKAGGGLFRGWSVTVPNNQYYAIFLYFCKDYIILETELRDIE
jgi:hypothetical protein